MKYVIMILFLMGPGISRADCFDYSGKYTDNRYVIEVVQNGCEKVEFKYHPLSDLTATNYDHIFTKIGNAEVLKDQNQNVLGSYRWKIENDRLEFSGQENYTTSKGEIIFSLSYLHIYRLSLDGSISDEHIYSDSQNGLSTTKTAWKKL